MSLVESNLIIVVDGDTVFTQSNTSKELTEHATDHLLFR